MPTERTQSAAFTHEYPRDVPSPLLDKDVVSYLAEYRFQLRKDHYELVFDGALIRDPFKGEPMTKRARRAIKKKESSWGKTTREEAELTGLQSLETQLRNTEDGLILWLSPPGPTEEGYGNYGFVFTGEVTRLPDLPTSRRLMMTAYRVEQPTLENFSAFFSALALTPPFSSAEEFIAHPKVVRGLSKQAVEALLPEFFSFHNSQKESHNFQEALGLLQPHIDEYIRMVQRGEPEESLHKTFNALENYALFLKTRLGKPQDFSFAQLIDYFGYQPRRVGGSCGSSSSGGLARSNNILNSISSLALSGESKNFHCPNCHQESQGPVGNQCPKCKITREEAQEKGLATC